MTKNLIAALMALAVGLAAAPAVVAQGTGGPLESRLEARKVIRAADGKESLAAADAAKPGDVIEYVATYRNGGAGAITGLQATMPIPPGTEFIPGTTRPATAAASLDGRAFSPIPLRRTVTRDGKQVAEPVPYREYRALRWNARELGGGKELAFTARVRVIDDRTPGEPGSKGGGT